MNTERKAIIIGAGVAGLACATRLTLQGFKVNVYEKNNYPGGKVSQVNLGNFNFDGGPSVFTQPENVVELFHLANEPVDDYITFHKLPVSCKYFYENGKVVNAYADPGMFAAEVYEKIGEDRKKVFSYLQRSRNVYTNIGNVFLHYSLHKIKSFFKAPLARALRATRINLLVGSLHQLNSKHFSYPETVQLFDRFATYNGSDPFRAPGMLSLISHVEVNQGSYYVTGGMKSIANALYQLALKKGVQFHFNTSVESIIHDNSSAHGVVVNGANINADLIISNIDVYYTYSRLLNLEAKAAKLATQERSSSAIIFYWGISKEFTELALHNIFFSNDYKAEFNAIFKLKTILSDPTVYVNITSAMEVGHAPAGKQNWFVMVNAPSNDKQNWQELRKECRSAVISKLNRILHTDFESLIEEEKIIDPVIIDEQTASYKGSLYGTSSNSKLAAFLRHPNFSAIRQLYFAGGTVHPGGGIPLCLKSAKLVCEIIHDDYTKVATTKGTIS